jgi:peptidoglycan/LPS O-acetylase OafA/YrhL
MRIEALTFLRFVAAFIVVVFHYLRDPKITPPAWMTAGPEMVSFFFALSGFVLTVSQWQRTESLGRFYWARLTRIAPVYWLALAGVAFVAPTLDAKDVALQTTFLQAWFPFRALRLNVTGWSISVELSFYAVFPALLLLLSRQETRLRTLLLGAAAFWALTQAVTFHLLNAPPLKACGPLAHALVYYFPPAHLATFLLGMVAGALFLRRPLPATPRARHVNGVLAVAAVLATGFALQHRAWPATQLGIYLPTGASVLAPLFAALVFFVARSTGPLARFFSLRPFVILGEASYAFYIFQHPLATVWATKVTKLIGFKMLLPDFLKFAGALLGLSIASVYAFEKPVRRLLLKVGSRRKPTSTAA